MKKTINNANLKIEDIDIVTNKVRALIIDSDNNIIVTKYADMFMLPGGKVDKGEELHEGLIRELKEELGIVFERNEIEDLIYIRDLLGHSSVTTTEIYTEVTINRKKQILLKYNYRNGI